MFLSLVFTFQRDNKYFLAEKDHYFRLSDQLNLIRELNREMRMICQRPGRFRGSRRHCNDGWAREQQPVAARRHPRCGSVHVNIHLGGVLALPVDPFTFLAVFLNGLFINFPPMIFYRRNILVQAVFFFFFFFFLQDN